LPSVYDKDYQLYQFSKKLGISEKQARKEYSWSEVFERNLFETYDDYVDRMLRPKA
jgi:hypothetical protein